MSAFEIRSGDVLEQLHQMPDACYSGVLTDPPYGLSFMGRTWDHGVPGVEVWREVLRVLKPGSMLLAFGGTRTHHRLMCAIEDAGFEIRDCILNLHGRPSGLLAWVYGSGFPKSHDISKAIDRSAGATREVIGMRRREAGSKSAHAFERCRELEFEVTAPATDDARTWSGYGTALKPSYEPIVLAMKPLERGMTYASNALRHGVAGLNIDASRIEANGDRRSPCGADGAIHRTTGNTYGKATTGETFDISSGRWPANLILDRESAMLLDQASGDSASSNDPNRFHNTSRFSGRTFAGDACSLAMKRGTVAVHADSGGASRFFYIAKADASERHASGQNQHPTVKPVDLCAYLAKLILPPETGIERKLLVPFSGSGSEIMGAMRAGWDSVTGIEADPAYVVLSERRIHGDAPLFNEAVTA